MRGEVRGVVGGGVGVYVRGRKRGACGRMMDMQQGWSASLLVCCELTGRLYSHSIRGSPLTPREA